MNDQLPLSYRTLSEPVHAEITEKRSRFLCDLVPVRTEEEAFTYLAAARKKYYDATHHCTALRLQSGVERANDDGEPSGTAGRPLLHVLQERGLTDVLAVVTRYFGGTLLGAGGLVRAYTSAVTTALSTARIVSYTSHDTYRFVLPYGDYERALHAFSNPAWEMTAEFADAVCISLCAPSSSRAVIAPLIAGLTRDTGSVTPIGTSLRPAKE